MAHGHFLCPGWPVHKFYTDDKNYKVFFNRNYDDEGQRLSIDLDHILEKHVKNIYTWMCVVNDKSINITPDNIQVNILLRQGNHVFGEVASDCWVEKKFQFFENKLKFLKETHFCAKVNISAEEAGRSFKQPTLKCVCC